MNLEPGVRIGAFQIVSRLGAGGMGEVYRARDRRLNRDVALKVLPDAFASDPERLARFEREAQAVAALSHPNVLAIHDFGTADGVTYAVLELLDGATLRDQLTDGPLPPRRAIEYAIQIASGLAAAHDKAIVHRDLKPENIFISADHTAKILDFGIAKVAATQPAVVGASLMPTTPANTIEGAVLGTVGYQSPEQVRGLAVDHRSDLFAFGAVLYEMLTGRPAFRGESVIERMHAILKDEPEFAAAAIAPSLERIIRRCLEKNPANRFQSAHDLRFALESLTAAGSTDAAAAVRGDTVSGQARTTRARQAAILVAVALIGAAAGYALKTAMDPPVGPTPKFTRITDRQRGTLRAARFGSDANTVIYSATWDGEPLRLYLARAGSQSSTLLDTPSAHLLAISRNGELAMSLGHSFDGWLGSGMLARAPLLGSGPRAMLENVRDADWHPDGSGLAVVRRVGGRDRLEWPIGKVLYQNNGFLSDVRFAPDGGRIAFVDHAVYGDNDGVVSVVDLNGAKQDLTPKLIGVRGIAWSADGREIWFAASTVDDNIQTLRAVNLSSRMRQLLPGAVDVALMDVARDGRVLLSHEGTSRHVEALGPVGQTMRDYAVFENSVARAITDDGSTLLLTTQGPSSVFVRRVAESSPVRIGDGEGYDFSPDGRWALSVVTGAPSRVLMQPLGPGETKELPNPQRLVINAVKFLPDGRRIVLLGGAAGEPWRGFVQDLDSGAVRPFTEPGVTFLQTRVIVLSPGGAAAAFTAPDGRVRLYPIAGGDAQPIPHLEANEFPLAWTADGRQMYVTHGMTAPWRIDRVDLASGQRTLWREVDALQKAGVRISVLAMSPTGQSVVHSYSQLLSTLYMVDGVR